MSISYEFPPATLRRPAVVAGDGAAWWSLPIVQVTCLCCWSLLLFVYGIHQGDLYRTEGLRAIIGQEMHRTGDWLVPRLYGEPILTKPPLFYWAIAATGSLLGEVTTWSSRLPAAIAGLIAVLIVYFTLRRYYGSHTGLIAALALPASFLWLEKASSSEIDTLLVMWVLAAWACFLRVMDGLAQERRSQFGWWLAALLCVAGGVMTKWTGFLFFYVMAIPLLVWYRQAWRLFHWHHLLAALIGMALVWCWLGAVVAELGWSTVFEMLWKEGAPRVLHGKSASQHLLLETALHPLKVLGLCLPWSAIVLVAWWKQRGAAIGSSKDEGGQFNPILVSRSLLCWALLGTLMMTCFPDHNIRQSFSLVPAWTLLGVLALRQLWICNALPRWIIQQPLRWGLAALACWLIVKVLYVQVLVPARYLQRPALAEQAQIMQAFVPAGATLYLSRVKDECLMFNYSHPVRRLNQWDQLAAAAATWCVLTEAERQAWPTPLVQRIAREQTLRDAQDEPLVMVEVRTGVAAGPGGK